MNHQIDFNKFRINKSRILSGRESAEKLRLLLKLDHGDLESKTTYHIIVPSDIYSLNTSYFLGLFGDSVRASGNRSKFLAKFKFECSKEIMEDVVYGIEQSLKEVKS